MPCHALQGFGSVLGDFSLSLPVRVHRVAGPCSWTCGSVLHIASRSRVLDSVILMGPLPI